MIYVIIGIVVLLILYLIGIYNSLVKLRNKVDDQSSQVDIELKKRFDLVPNLVETVKGYVKHEKETLESVINARNSFNNAGNMNEELAANDNLSNALTKLFALSESYPDLKANENFINLQNSLNEIEENIAYKRSFYNETVRLYNDKVMTVPSNIVANIFNFKEREYFQINESERKNVKVSF